MTDRRDEGYSVRPVRIGEPGAGGGPRRGRRLGVAIVLVAALGIVAIGWIGPRLEAAPYLDIGYFATPTPDPNASPSTVPSASRTPLPPSGPTPLPAVTRNGATVLQGRLGIWTEAFHSVDLETGALSGPITGTFGTDAFLPATNGDGWTCVCMVDRVDSARMEREVDVVRLSASGLDLQRQKVTTFAGDQSPVEQGGSSGVQTDVAVSPDGRTALVVAGQRERGGWSFEATSIDLASATVVGTTTLGRKDVPKPGPSPLPSTASDGTPTLLQTDVYGPQIRRSPDGRHALVWTTLQQYTQDASLLTEVFGWSVALDADGNVAGTAPSPGISSLPPYCGGMGFIDDATFAAVCAVNTSDSTPPAWGLQRLDADGHSVGTLPLPGTPNWYTEPIFDLANRIVWLWDPNGLVLHRIELDSNRITSQGYDALVERADGSARPPDHQPVFARANSSLFQDVSWDMAAAPDGSRLYLVGYDAAKQNERGNQASAGIFVVDPGTLALLDRWDPDAQYFAVQPIDDGSVVVAAGAPAVDADGNSVPWQASLTFHDASDGRILLRLGQIGDGAYPQILHR
jgi:hypothetical protein